MIMDRIIYARLIQTLIDLIVLPDIKYKNTNARDLLIFYKAIQVFSWFVLIKKTVKLVVAS